jgi:hypothetical protein
MAGKSLGWHFFPSFGIGFGPADVLPLPRGIFSLGQLLSPSTLWPSPAVPFLPPVFSSRFSPCSPPFRVSGHKCPAKGEKLSTKSNRLEWDWTKMGIEPGRIEPGRMMKEADIAK